LDNNENEILSTASLFFDEPKLKNVVLIKIHKYET